MPWTNTAAGQINLMQDPDTYQGQGIQRMMNGDFVDNLSDLGTDELTRLATQNKLQGNENAYNYWKDYLKEDRQVNDLTSQIKDAAYNQLLSEGFNNNKISDETLKNVYRVLGEQGYDPEDIAAQYKSNMENFYAGEQERANRHHTGFSAFLEKAMPAFALGIVTGGAGAALGGALGGASLATSIGTSLGLEAGAGAATLGSAVIGAGTNALMASLTGGDVGKAATLGAIGGGIGANSMDIASNIMGRGDATAGLSNIKSIADAIGQTPKQVANIISNTVSTAVSTAAVKGGDPTKLILNNLASTIIGNYAGNIVDKLDTGKINTAVSLASGVAKVGTTAALNGGDIGSAITNSLPSIIGNTIGNQFKNDTSKPSNTKDLSSTNYENELNRVFASGQVDPVDISNNPSGQVAGDGTGIITLNDNTPVKELKGPLSQVTDTYPNGNPKSVEMPDGTINHYDEDGNLINSVPPNDSTDTGLVNTSLGGEEETGALPTTGDKTVGALTGGTTGDDDLETITITAPKPIDEEPTIYVDAPKPKKDEEPINEEPKPTSPLTTTPTVRAPLTSTPTVSTPLTKTTTTSPTATPTAPLSANSSSTVPTVTQPPNIQGTSLAAAPISGQNTKLLGELKQLYPQLSQVNPKLLSQLGYQPEAPLQQAQQQYNPSSSETKFASGFNLPSLELPTLKLKSGGVAHIPEFITGHTGHYVSGKGDGQSDDIKALLSDGDYVIDAESVAQLGNGSSKAGREVLDKFRGSLPHSNHANGGKIPAMIADGEYVLPSGFVSALGRGSSDKGAKQLDKMRESLREHKRSAPLNKIPPKSKSPLEYLQEGIKMKEKR